jgi:hypothetical protein
MNMDNVKDTNGKRQIDKRTKTGTGTKTDRPRNKRTEEKKE